MYFVKQSVQDDSSLLLDVNAMSAVTEDRRTHDHFFRGILHLPTFSALKVGVVMSWAHTVE